MEEDGEWAAAQLVKFAELERWKDAKAGGPGRDRRLLPEHRNARGIREVTLSEAADSFQPLAQLLGWPFEGPRAVEELLSGIRRAGHSLGTYDERWSRSSGVRQNSALA